MSRRPSEPERGAAREDPAAGGRVAAAGAIPEELAGGRYRVVRPLGGGGSAVVVEAWDEARGAPVALKLLPPGAPFGARRRLREEAEAVGRVAHRHVLRVLEVGEDAERLWVAMELAVGGSLQDRLDRWGPLPVEEATGYLQQLLAALGAAHAAGVVHRDVKPQNVLLDADGVARLADFGVALLRAELDPARVAGPVGSFAYMPPEQRLAPGSVDERVDVYAAGATLYALLTAGNPVDLHTAGPGSARWQGLPRPLVRVLRSATAERVEDRPPSARSLGRALAEAVDALPTAVLAAPAVAPRDEPGARPAVSAEWTRATRDALAGLAGPGWQRRPAPAPAAEEPAPEWARRLGGDESERVDTLPRVPDAAGYPARPRRVPTPQRS